MDNFHIEAAISEKTHLLLLTGQIGGRLFEFFAQHGNGGLPLGIGRRQQRLDKLVRHAFG